MSTYSIFGVEEVYDAFDEYEHANVIPPFSVLANSIDEAKTKGEDALRQCINYNRKGLFSSGWFIARVIQIADELGYLVFDDSQRLVQTWPFTSDERSLIPNSKLPIRVCFIAYNNRDKKFAQRLSSELKKRRYMTWFAPERPDMPGLSLEDEQLIKNSIAEGIQSARIMLIMISDNSLASSWVAFETSTAIDGERRSKRPVIFGLQIAPITIQVTWLSEIRERYGIRDFIHWRNDLFFEEQVDKLSSDMTVIFEKKSM